MKIEVNTDLSQVKDKYKKNERLINLIAAFALVAQFISSLTVGLLTAKRSKATSIAMIISAIGGAVGSYFLYKELIAPALSKKLAEYTLGDKENSFDLDDDFNSYSDSVEEPDYKWYEDDFDTEEDEEENKEDTEE